MKSMVGAFEYAPMIKLDLSKWKVKDIDARGHSAILFD